MDDDVSHPSIMADDKHSQDECGVGICKLIHAPFAGIISWKFVLNVKLQAVRLMNAKLLGEVAIMHFIIIAYLDG
ncbi:uncharacterized protein MONOS_7770 [Monocercomonoides exilis]|uniref:uncharacterized protein n=1 Tax=Monocercomonoides exilis TaxID=2049356 RepID=UPI00355AAFBD|nr:hypothetical protein MONOS_7770 [Monocercomonoides exilis]|eukprot:MONOS_7770.1-p1 / transcript=MONOS_7770.1 / gene=MONOS_7770 / organism=Monocercomonoides_exilis_PA203 / gene_product=unspecified product / transcript_product=unspecified product / location=Mono_scaffold00274:42153-42588(-) / protein_length=75 / sequence_SO=supercontig / SO=protein_coding / is_pseudo=false